MKPVSPSVRRATLPLGRITKWVMLPLLRDRRSQPSGGNCSALVTKTHDQLDYQTLTAPPSVPDKGEEGENQNWWALCGLHSTGRSQPWKKAFSCGSAIKPQHWQLDQGQECTWLSRAQQMGVITADRISARGQKAAAGMQWGVLWAAPSQTGQGMAQAPALPVRLQHHNTCAGGTGQSWLSTQGLPQQRRGGCGKQGLSHPISAMPPQQR